MTDRESIRPLHHLMTCITAGLATGLVEVMIIVVKWTLLHRFVWTGLNVIWMAPVYYLALFSGLGLFLSAVAAVTGSRLPYAITVTACGALGAFAILVLLFFGHIALITLAIVALAIGIQLSRLVRPRQARVAARTPRTALAAALAVLALATGLPLARHLRERYQIAHLPPARAGAPNVLLIILDTVRAASLSLYGYGRPTTPRLDRRATGGTVFERGIAASSWTLPSHATIFTGTNPQRLSASWLIPLGAAHGTLAEIFQAHGYRTGGFVANLFYTSRESGLSRGFQHYDDYQNSRGQFLLSTAFAQYLRSLRRNRPQPRRLNDRKTGEEVSRQFLDWVDRDPSRPFFAFLNYYDAHTGYRALPPWRQRFDDPDNRIRGRYDASIAYLDVVIDNLLRTLASRGVLQNTLVILTSDHGEQVGEHGLREHANSLYDVVLHVPLVLWYPGHVPAGRRVATPVTLRDLGATILDLTGNDDQSFPGVSLRGAWEDSSWRGSPLLSHLRKGINTPPEEPVSRGDMFSLYQGSWHYILNGDGVPELYDLAYDRSETHDLSHDACCRIRLQDLAITLNGFAQDTSRPRATFHE